jgi:hypothetical protein
MRRCPLSRNPEVGVTAIRGVVGAGPGRMTDDPQIISGQKSSWGKRGAVEASQLRFLRSPLLDNFRMADKPGVVAVVVPGVKVTKCRGSSTEVAYFPKDESCDS